MITTNTQNTANPAATSGQPASSPPKKGLTTDFETFLKMLTTQARNQDPLEPLNGSEYAAQLAQFSMVEQQVKTNDTLATLITKLGNSDMTALTNWIGKQVRAIAPAHFSGAPISITPEIADGAERANLVVRDSAGEIVERKPIALTATQISWTGLDDSGAKRPNGTYSFSVESFKDDKLMQDKAAATYNSVVEAQVQNGDIRLVLEGGKVIAPTAVTGIRAGG